MKLRLSLLALCFVLMIVLLTETSVTQTSAQSSPDNPPHSMQQDSQPPSLASSLNKGERKIRGCIRSENGKYVVESRLHKKIWLSGPEDLGPNVGHTVVLYGTYLNATAPATSGTVGQKNSSKSVAESVAHRQGSNFQVSKAEVVSDTCATNNVKSSNQP